MKLRRVMEGRGFRVDDLLISFRAHHQTAMMNSAGRLKRFRREASAVVALNHPPIVTIYSVEEAEGVHFLTMSGRFTTEQH